MRPYACSLIVAAAAVALAPAQGLAEDLGPSCQVEITATGSASWSRTVADKINSLYVWRRVVGEELGSQYKNWSTARDRKVACAQEDGRWRCTRTAKPCFAGALEGPATSPLVVTGDGPRRFGDETLALGDAGLYVRRLQRTLARQGYDLEIDGDFGTATREAVRGFQRSNGLTVDGKVGNETKAALAARPWPFVASR